MSLSPDTITLLLGALKAVKHELAILYSTHPNPEARTLAIGAAYAAAEKAIERVRQEGLKR